MGHSSDRSQLFKGSFDSPEGLADHIGEVLNCPITIEDSYHRLISYSKHEENVDDARIATIISRKVPENVINSLWKSGVMSKLFESDAPVIVPAINKVGLGNRIAISVRKNNKILGFIWAQTDDKAMGDDTLQLLKEAAELVRVQLQKHHKKEASSEESYHEFFWQLLTGHVHHESEIQRQAKRFGLQLEGNLATIVIEFNGEIKQRIEKHADYLTGTLQQVYVVCQVFDQSQLILLVRIDSTESTLSVVKSFIRDFIHKISERLQLKQVKGSCGIIYTNPKYMKDSYKQALRVLELKEQFPNELHQVYGYQELGIHQFLDELYTIRKKDHYQNNSIEKLKAYDSLHNTDLLSTMKTYLECNSNVQKAADLIHVHPNTLNYRLKRIVDITEIDLKDPSQKVTLYLDLKMYHT